MYARLALNLQSFYFSPQSSEILTVHTFVSFFPSGELKKEKEEEEKKQIVTEDEYW